MSVTATRAVAATPLPAAGPPKLWFDGALVPADTPLAPATTHAMHYGSGVFEGMRS
jgi:branched-chain amino acid aminotransferase